MAIIEFKVGSARHFVFQLRHFPHARILQSFEETSFIFVAFFHFYWNARETNALCFFDTTAAGFQFRYFLRSFLSKCSAFSEDLQAFLRFFLTCFVEIELHWGSLFLIRSSFNLFSHRLHRSTKTFEELVCSKFGREQLTHSSSCSFATSEPPEAKFIWRNLAISVEIQVFDHIVQVDFTHLEPKFGRDSSKLHNIYEAAFILVKRIKDLVNVSLNCFYFLLYMGKYIFLGNNFAGFELFVKL